MGWTFCDGDHQHARALVPRGWRRSVQACKSAVPESWYLLERCRWCFLIDAEGAGAAGTK